MDSSVFQVERYLCGAPLATKFLGRHSKPLLSSIATTFGRPEVGPPVTHSHKHSAANDVADRYGQEIPP